MWKAFLRILRSARKGLDNEYRSFTERFLDANELFLFDQMAPWDQYHTVNTAMYALKKCTGVGSRPNTDITVVGETKIHLLTLIKAALLHDIGKVKGYAGLPTRLYVSFIRRAFPNYRRRHANHSGNRIQHALYVDLVHPVRGAYMALSAGVHPAVADLIRRHHDEPRDSDSIELKILQKADAKS